MNSQSFTVNSRVIAELSFNETQVTGFGGAYCPRLIVIGKLTYSSMDIPTEDHLFDEINATLSVLGGPARFADALPCKLSRIRRGHWDFIGNDQVHLEFPVDQARLALLEARRDGGDLHLHLVVKLTVQKFGRIPEHTESNRPAFWGLTDQHESTVEFNLKIPRSVWLERVLPQTGYGVVHVLEFPAAPLESCQSLRHSFDALKQAQERLKLGQYDDAVAKCRIALDPFFEHVEQKNEQGETKKIPVLKRTWETRLGAATYA